MIGYYNFQKSGGKSGAGAFIGEVKSQISRRGNLSSDGIFFAVESNKHTFVRCLHPVQNNG